MNMCSLKTEKRIKIGLIDTGVDITHPDFQNATITQYCVQGDSIRKVDEPEDKWGHGTACASIIHKLEPQAEIVSIQCLDYAGTSDGSQILIALEWCIEQGIDVINLSFGALSTKLQDSFSVVGQKAVKSNILMFAACHDSGYLSMPANLPEYLAVLGKSIKGKYAYYYQDNIFIAHGGRQRVGWITPRFIIAEGSSFATARMSAIAARIKRNSGSTEYNDLISKLHQCAQTGPITKLPSISRNHAIENNSPFFSIQKAAIYSFTKEMHNLLYFPDLTGIQITSITDLPFKPNIHKKVSQLMPLDLELEVCPDAFFKRNLKDADTVIISRTSEYESITQRDCMGKILERAIASKKNVYSLEYLDADMYPEIYKAAKKNECFIRHPMLNYDDLYRALFYRDMYGHLDNETPIIGVFGTGPSQGKFTAQLMMRRLLKNRGYKVNNYGTETHCELFGFEGYYPLEMDASVKFPEQEMLSFIQGDIRRLEITNRPDIIVVGGQSGTVPHSYALKSREYTLPTLSFLMATLPHAYILAINSQDEMDFIGDTIHVLEGIGKAKVIAIICSSQKKFSSDSSVAPGEKITLDEFFDLKARIFHLFGLPVFDIFKSKDSEDLCNLVLSFFS